MNKIKFKWEDSINIGNGITSKTFTCKGSRPKIVKASRRRIVQFIGYGSYFKKGYDVDKIGYKYIYFKNDNNQSYKVSIDEILKYKMTDYGYKNLHDAIFIDDIWLSTFKDYKNELSY